MNSMRWKNVWKLSSIKGIWVMLSGLYAYPFWSSVSGIRRAKYALSLSAITFICLACYSHRSASLMDSLPVRNFFLYLRTILQPSTLVITFKFANLFWFCHLNTFMYLFHHSDILNLYLVYRVHQNAKVIQIQLSV